MIGASDVVSVGISVHRGLWRVRWGGLLVAGLVMLASCGRGASSDPVTASTSPGTTSSANSGISVVKEELYRESTSADGVGSTVDIYVGDGNEGAPLVVLLHGYSSTGPGSPDDDLGPPGEGIAGLGSTVFYFGWQTTRGYSADSFADLSCAGLFVAARAAEFGADPDNVIVVGHSQGATSGGMLAFSSFDLTPSPGCTEDGRASSPVAFFGIAGGYGVMSEPLDEDQTRFRVRTSLAVPFRELDADEEIVSGLTAAKIYQLDGYSALPPVNELNIVLLVGSDDQYPVTNAAITAQFADTLQAPGVNVEVVTIEGANHDDIVDPTTEYGQATHRVTSTDLHVRRWTVGRGQPVIHRRSGSP